ncbi:MAG: ectonucleotide pyrophosphatase/phosphodiesterase [Fimbriimonadales bacterium]|nr:ectonucleotide pyrophosphatase/phosphodiesterase [Fimbriimonadales bacterium]
MAPRTVLLASIDGLRPDALSPQRTPNLWSLLNRGCHTLSARSVMPSVTLPCHTSMMRGVDVDRHGITTNLFQPLARPVPSLFDVATGQGVECAMFFNWGPLRDLCEPESAADIVIHASFSQPEDDAFVTEALERYVARRRYGLVFLYLGHTDHTGHQFGWMSDEYLAAASHADACLGRAIRAIADRWGEPNVLALSDHGGHGRAHGTDLPEDMTIPFLLAGPDVPRLGELPGEVRLFDAAPTVAGLLGIQPSPIWEGRDALDRLKAAEA